MVCGHLIEWGSKALLQEHLHTVGYRTVVVGSAAESPRRYFSCKVDSGFGLVEVGVISSGLGPVPGFVSLEQGRVLLVGHDAWLTWVSIEELPLVSLERRLGGVFFKFLAVGDSGVVVIHELGAVRVDAKGREMWCVDTDVLEDYWLDGCGRLILSAMGDPSPVVISIDQGAAG